MPELWIAYATAFALGAAHALEVDHMVAVTTFVGGQPQVKPAIAFGVRWGLGHSVVVLVAGGLLALSGLTVPEAAEGWAELAVGIVLIALGLWAIRNARRLHFHDPASHGGHAHLHAHAPGDHPHEHHHVQADPGRRHRHLPTMIGAVHGLAGTAPVVALIPVTLIGGLGAALVYLAMFGLGTVLAMGLYAAVAAVAVQRAAKSVKAARMAALLTAGASVVVGVIWIVMAAGELASG